MAYKLMYNPNVDTQNYPFYRLKLVAETIKKSTKWINQFKFTKVVKVGNPTNRKALLYDFGDFGVWVSIDTKFPVAIHSRNFPLIV